MNAPIVRLTNAERLAAEALARALEPPAAIDYLDFATRHVVFSEAISSQFPGPYNPDTFPFFSEILRALGPDDPCRTVTLAKSAQLGGTILAVIFTLGTLAHAKGLMLYVHPTEDNARRWSKTKLAGLMRSTAIVAEQFPRSSRDASDSVLYKERRDGLAMLQISGANSPASLSMLTAERQVQDDLSKWTVNDAGDPEGQADSRSQAVEFAKLFKISTPLVNPGCKISRNLIDGTQEYFEVPCPHCDAFQVLEWDNLRAVIEAGHVEGAHFTCVACGAAIEDFHRAAIARRGRWVARNPSARKRHRSFHIWSAYSPLQSLARIAHAWLKARGAQQSEQNFLNDVAGLPFETAGAAPPWEEIRNRAEAQGHRRGTIPPGHLVLTMGIDVQGNRVEWQVLAHARNRAIAVVDVGVIDGAIHDEATGLALDQLLASRWRNAVGRDLGLDRVAIDGNAFTDDVLAWARRHPVSKVMMVRGVKGEAAPKLAAVKREKTRAGKVRKYGGRFYNVGVSGFKLALYHHLAKTDPAAPGFIAHPKGLPDDYYQQLTAERRVEVRRAAGVSYEWHLDPSLRNEALDTFIYASAAAFRFIAPSDPWWDRLESERESPLADAQGDLEDWMSGRDDRPARTPSAPVPAMPTPAAMPAAARPRPTARRISRSSLIGR